MRRALAAIAILTMVATGCGSDDDNTTRAQEAVGGTVAEETDSAESSFEDSPDQPSEQTSIDGVSGITGSVDITDDQDYSYQVEYDLSIGNARVEVENQRPGAAELHTTVQGTITVTNTTNGRTLSEYADHIFLSYQLSDYPPLSDDGKFLPGVCPGGSDLIETSEVCTIASVAADGKMFGPAATPLGPDESISLPLSTQSLIIMSEERAYETVTLLEQGRVPLLHLFLEAPFNRLPVASCNDVIVTAGSAGTSDVVCGWPL